MWSFIQPRLARLAGRPASRHGSRAGSLAGLEILDAGIGYGDFMLRALQDGVDFAVGIDRDGANINYATTRLQRAGIGHHRYRIYNADLSEALTYDLIKMRGYDVGLCTSVLPYLRNPDNLLAVMSLYCAVSIVECQYFGDGPGYESIKNDGDMKRWLMEHWESVQKIGETKLDIRPATRSIWMCSITRHIS